MTADRISELSAFSARVSGLVSKLRAEEAELGKTSAEVRRQEEELKCQLKNFRDEIAEGKSSAGNVLRDYVWVNAPPSPGDDIGKYIKEKGKAVQATLDMLSGAEVFWTGNGGYALGATDYRVMFLGKEKTRISPSELTVVSRRELHLKFEQVFAKGCYWVFPTLSDSQGELKVQIAKVMGVSLMWGIPVIEEQCENTSFQALEDRIKNPLALAHLARARGKVVDEKAEADYIHGVAVKAALEIKGQYEELKRLDRTILQIEQQWNPDSSGGVQLPTVMPTLPPIEADPVMAAIMSSGARDSRTWTVKRLAQDMVDLDRTGLSGYTKPIEVRVMEGQNTVYNLSSLSKYIRHVLELNLQKKAI